MKKYLVWLWRNTTLFRLMLALIKPDEGTMTLYGWNGRQYISEQTRSNFVFVPQGNTLMSGSIRKKPNRQGDR